MVCQSKFHIIRFKFFFFFLFLVYDSFFTGVSALNPTNLAWQTGRGVPQIIFQSSFSAWVFSRLLSIQQWESLCKHLARWCNGQHSRLWIWQSRFKSAPGLCFCKEVFLTLRFFIMLIDQQKWHTVLFWGGPRESHADVWLVVWKSDSCGVRTHALADWRLKPAP